MKTSAAHAGSALCVHDTQTPAPLQCETQRHRVEHNHSKMSVKAALINELPLQ